MGLGNANRIQLIQVLTTMIFIDLETTDLIHPHGTYLNLQPKITEIYAVKVDKKFRKIKVVDSLINPGIPIPKFIQNHTGITDKMVKDAPPFEAVYKPLKKLFKGSKMFIAHNAPFDKGVIEIELKRLGKLEKFPFPPDTFCTVEQSLHIKGFRMTLKELHILATGKPVAGAHRAEADVDALIRVYKWLNK